MAVTIEGVHITDLKIEKDKKEGKLEVHGNYEIVTSTGAVIAKQAFNGGYNEIKVGQSPETTKLLQQLHDSVSKDINATMGFN